MALARHSAAVAKNSIELVQRYIPIHANMKLVKIGFLRTSTISGMLIAPIGLITAPNSYSQYTYTSPSFFEDALPSATESSFSIDADGIS